MQSVTFSSAFSSAPVITLTVEQPYTNVTVSAMLQYGTVTTNGFTYMVSSGGVLWSGISPPVHWIAIGY